MEIRRRVEAGGRGRARPGATACAPGMSTTTGVSISTSRTGGRTSCSATVATAPSRKSPRARVSRPAAGAPAAPFSTRTPTATWTCMSRATSRRRGTRSCARSGRSSGATGRASWSARPGFPARPICSSRTSGTAASWKRPRPTGSPIRPAPTASASSRPTTTTTGSSISSSPTTRTPTSCIATWGTAASRASGSLAGVAVNGEARAQAGMGADAGDYDGDARMDLVLTAFAHDRNTLYRNVDGRQFEDASVTAGLAAPTFVRMGWGTAFLDADLDGRLDLFFANGHIFSDIEKLPAARGDVPSEEPVPAQYGHALPRRLGARRRRPAGRARRPRRWPSAISTTTAIPTSS